MPQKFGLYEDLTVMNTDATRICAASPARAHKQTFARLLEFTSLGPFTGRLAGKLSGGMKQKLGLACTLVGEPELLSMNPASALTLSHGANCGRWCMSWRAKGC